MEKYPLTMTVVAVGIIFLLFGIAFIPSIAINMATASNDNNLVKITTQTFDGNWDYTFTGPELNTTTSPRNTTRV